MGKRRRALLFAGAVTVLAFVFILFFVLSGQISENLEESSYDYLYGSTEIIRRIMGSGKMNGGLSVSQMGWQVKTGRAWKEKWPLFATIMTLTICTLWGKME